MNCMSLKHFGMKSHFAIHEVMAGKVCFMKTLKRRLLGFLGTLGIAAVLAGALCVGGCIEEDHGHHDHWDHHDR